jgi:hypothetical protein
LYIAARLCSTWKKVEMESQELQVALKLGMNFIYAKTASEIYLCTMNFQESIDL